MGTPTTDISSAPVDAVSSAPSEAEPTESTESTSVPTDLVIHYGAADGTKMTASFSLKPPVPAGDSSVSDLFPGGAPCDADPQRDAVIAGTLTITNDTPDFTGAIEFAVTTAASSMGDATLNFGAAYSNGPKCTDINGEYGGYGAMQPAIDPTMETASWGPVNVEFVVHNVYSPATPKGDMSVISDNTPILVAFEGPPTNGQQYGVKSVSGPVDNMMPGAVKLRLDELG